MGTGTDVATDEAITAAKMNLKLESVDGSDLASGASQSVTFLANAFQYPAPGTDWTPVQRGAQLGANKTAKKVWLPLNFLKTGDVVTKYRVLGDVHEEGGDTVTLDCKMLRVKKTDPLATDAVTNSSIVQVDSDGNFDVEADNQDFTTLTDKFYTLEISGTTSNVSGNEAIIVTGAEVQVTRLL